MNFKKLQLNKENNYCRSVHVFGIVLLLAVLLMAKEDALAVTVIYTVDSEIPYGGTIPTDASDYNVGDTVTLSDGGDLSLSGYEFVGWSKTGNISGTGDIIAKGANLVIDPTFTDPLTLHAIFRKKMPKLTFDYAGANVRPVREEYYVGGYTSNQIISRINGQVDEYYYMPLARTITYVSPMEFALSKQGHTFKGVYAGQDGSSTVLITDTLTYNQAFLDSIQSDIIVYAFFIPDNVGGGAVTPPAQALLYRKEYYNADGSLYFTTDYTEGESPQMPQDPVMQGYVFARWEPLVTEIDAYNIWVSNGENPGNPIIIRYEAVFDQLIANRVRQEEEPLPEIETGPMDTKQAVRDAESIVLSEARPTGQDDRVTFASAISCDSTPGETVSTPKPKLFYMEGKARGANSPTRDEKVASPVVMPTEEKQNANLIYSFLLLLLVIVLLILWIIIKRSRKEKEYG